jgi:mannose-6-phosphate isomerase-like protein (cupin superfamily)
MLGFAAGLRSIAPMHPFRSCNMPAAQICKPFCGHRVGIFGVFRLKSASGAGVFGVHQTNVSENYYMLEGAGMLVTGGKLKQPLLVSPQQSTQGNWTDLGSTGIEGGTSRRIAKGDVVIIPGGVPHGWASTEGQETLVEVVERLEHKRNMDFLRRFDRREMSTFSA